MSSTGTSTTAMQAVRDEVRTLLSTAGLKNIDNDVLSKLIGLSESLNFSPTAIAECWEAYSLTKNVNTLDTHSFPAFRLKLIKESDNPLAAALINDDKNSAVRVTAYKHDMTSAVITPAHLKNKKRPSGIGNESNSSDYRRVSLSPSTPVLSFTPTATTSSSVSSSASHPAYGERQGVGKVVVTYNPSARTVTPTSAIDTPGVPGDRPKCIVSTNFDTNVRDPYRHWFTILEDRALSLDLQLQQHSNIFSKQYDFGSDQIAALEAIGIPRQEAICCIGRVCNVAHEGRINATSVSLEGSRHMSGGARVEVDLSYMKSNQLSYSLFPGQIVAIEGMNCSGRKLVAQRICEGAPHAPVQSSVAELMKFHHGDNYQGGAPLKVVVASGPFTCSDNLSYEPFIDLVNTIVMKSKPDVVILAGPFVDKRQKSVESGETYLPIGKDGKKILVPYETIFMEQISSLLEELYFNDASLQTQFILVPSLDDATMESSYPQAPFQITAAKQTNIPGAAGVEIGTLGIHTIEDANRQPSVKNHQRVHCVSNPCTFQINEVVFGVTSTDVLFHIGADETNANLENGTRISRIAQHLVQQRSYYPLFPASSDTNLNLKYMNQWQMSSTPDVLILPSKFLPFCLPLLDNTSLVVNPGHLARANMGGTYAIMDIYPIARDVLENAGGDDVRLKHNINDRTYVEIKRI